MCAGNIDKRASLQTGACAVEENMDGAVSIQGLSPFLGVCAWLGADVGLWVGVCVAHGGCAICT